MADKKQRTALWKGLNRMSYIRDGEMRNMRNLSSDAYPFITTRKGRKPYTFITKIPSPEGEAYRDIERLPEPSENEEGNVYKVTVDAVEPEYVSGEFYYYNGETWIEGKKKKELHGATTVAGENYLISSDYVRHERTAGRYPHYADNSTYSTCTYYDMSLEKSPLLTSETSGFTTNYTYRGLRVKYRGETKEKWIKDKTYVYTMYVKARWEEGTNDSNYFKGNVAELPRATILSAKNRSYYRYTGETTEEFTKDKHYKCVVDSYCVWEECESQYDVVETMPAEPVENQQVRFISKQYGSPMKKGYYLCKAESDENGNLVYFYSKASEKEDCKAVGFLPLASVDNEGINFCYEGPTATGEFARCYLNNGYYDWEVVEHPQVERTVTLKDYLDNYEGSGLTEILEIGSLNGSLAALIRDNIGSARLYYRQKLYGDIKNLTEESGKKLVMVGNRLIVGESGSYIREKEGAIEYFEMPETFSLTVSASNTKYGGNFDASDRIVYSEAAGGPNKTTFILYGSVYRPGKGEENPNGMYEKLAEVLSVPGTGFVAYGKRSENSKKQYLKVTSVEFKKEYFLLGYPDREEYNEYTSRLIIKAEGAKESFDWNIENKSDKITFESTDPHYYDVVAWKKRLWGYQDNVFFGTVQDIWGSKGVVDWNTGDNTHTEAISQPLWQGGNITGVAALMSGLVFFKEDSITVVQGNYPAVMSSNTIPCRGLPPENRRTVAVGNEAVYYLGRNGVMRFDGGIPRCISQEAKISGTEAVGFSDGEKYYLSLKEADGKYALYVYDITFETWHKEDCEGAVSFVMLNGELHMAMGDEIYNIYAPQEDVPWEFELWYDEGTHCKKKYKEIIVRGNVGECELWLKADDGEWKFIGAVTDKMIMKFIPFDCEELSLKLKGKGKCEIKSIDRTFEIVE